jgi:hypothetical protein
MQRTTDRAGMACGGPPATPVWHAAAPGHAGMAHSGPPAMPAGGVPPLIGIVTSVVGLQQPRPARARYHAVL